MMVMTAVTSSQTEQATVVDDLVIANRVLVNEGVLDGLGHISARHQQRPDRFLLSRDLPPALAVRFIFPHAPMIPMTMNNGYVMRA